MQTCIIFVIFTPSFLAFANSDKSLQKMNGEILVVKEVYKADL
jgi:hypothetical protein